MTPSQAGIQKRIAQGLWKSFTAHLFRHLNFTFLNKYASIKIAANLYPVHRFASGIQAKNMVIGLTDIFYSTDFVLADSSHAVFQFERHATRSFPKT